MRPLVLNMPSTPNQAHRTPALATPGSTPRRPTDRRSRWEPPVPPATPATPFGTQIPNTGPVGVEYLKHVPFVMPEQEWRVVRDYLLRAKVCTVYNVFETDDKQFQHMVTNTKPPPALRDIGTASFSIEAWRDVREYFEALDVWNLFCSIICGNFRGICDNAHSISLGADTFARTLEQLPTQRFVGHTQLSVALSRWHWSFVIETKTVLCGNLSSVLLRDRLIRPAILLVINADAKTFVRSSFLHDDSIFVSYTVVLPSWRFKEDEVWSALFECDAKLSSKKPRGNSKTVRDWRSDLERWREERLSLANGIDIDGDQPQMWMMRILQSCSGEPWYSAFRKQMHQNERNGIYIQDDTDLWSQLEFEEKYSPGGERRVNLLEDGSAHADLGNDVGSKRSCPDLDAESGALVVYVDHKRRRTDSDRSSFHASND